MKNPYFFGYGSLVNQSTHSYPNAAQATVNGWRRAWVNTANRPFAYLTAIRAGGHQISGLIAEVPNADWAALDKREDSYERLPATKDTDHTHAHANDIAIYAVPSTSFHQPSEPAPILLSYLDVVFQGYLTEFGQDGARDFVHSTDGWDTPILNDRHAPKYPRHQLLSGSEQAFVDETLRGLGSRLID